MFLSWFGWLTAYVPSSPTSSNMQEAVYACQPTNVELGGARTLMVSGSTAHAPTRGAEKPAGFRAARSGSGRYCVTTGKSIGFEARDALTDGGMA